MGSLQGPVICPSVRVKQVGFYTLPTIGPFMKARLLRSEFWGLKGIKCSKTKVGILPHQLHLQKCKTVHCSYSSPSDGNGSMAENFNINDEDYVNSSVIEAGKLSQWQAHVFARNSHIIVDCLKPILFLIAHIYIYMVVIYFSRDDFGSKNSIEK